MPELPEVHTTATELAKYIIGLTITHVWTDYDSPYFYGKHQIKDPAYFMRFKKEVIGATIQKTGRIGKNVLIHLSNKNTILVHMKMTGHLLYGRYTFDEQNNTWQATEKGPLRDDKWNGYIHLVFAFDNNQHLALSDLRKFAKVTLIPTDKLHDDPELKVLGPDPLASEFSFSVFKEILLKRPQGKVKQVLMDQTLLAGIGNIYSDEALWLSKIHPETPITKLTESTLKTLYTNTKKVLKKGIDFGGDSTSDYRGPDGRPGAFQHKHKAYRRTGENCTRKSCDGTIKRTIVGGRSAHFCSQCQKK